MRFLLVCVFALTAWAQSITVLDQQQIVQLEKTLAQDPGDRQGEALLGQNYAFVILGITKLGKYDRVEGVDPAKARSELAGHARDTLRQSPLPGVVGEGGQALWQYSTQVESFKILNHSPDQTPLRDERVLAIAAIDRAVSMEPDNGRWRTNRIRVLAMRANGGRTATLSVDDAYAQARQDIAILKGKDRYYQLDIVAKLGVNAKAWSDAKVYAQELLDAAADNQDWNSGNAVFYGNMVLGQVALHDGNKVAAREYLAASGKTKGSPQLNSFGPNMSLAKDLLEAGESDAVLSFFESCAVFWKMNRGVLDRWKSTVAAGRTPDFGANLLY